jgi:hypothetical protein
VSVEIHSLAAVKKAAKDAIEVQNACNLSGVLLAWHQAACALMAHHQSNSDPLFLRHPINILFMSKVSSLMGVNTDCIGGIKAPQRGEMVDAFSQAYDACKELINE